MPTFIKVICKTPPPHAGSHTPHRFWANGESRTLEVVPDGPTVAWLEKHKPERRGQEDLAARKLQVAGGPYLHDGTPDPERITESGVKAIEACPHLSFMSQGGEGGEMQSQALDAARQVAQRANEKLADAEIALARMEGYNRDLDDQVRKLEVERGSVGRQMAELMQENQELRKQLDEVTAPAPIDSNTVVDDDAKTDEGKGGKGKGKGGK